ncbi:hypothetical protein [Chromobacterium haemolyticum]|uniref:hypothetical protein n=1 Tax=Chromobacterium haemolyticum TaxID=394935 RepID=UPI0005BE8EE7|nr:hypothetical protein [Chromobacterium haemolyticum]
MSILSALGKGLFTAARIADAGLSLYQVTDEAWTMIDPDSRYPELRDLMEQLLKVGKEYDEKLDSLIVKSNSLTNLSNGLYTLNGTVQLMDDKGVEIFERYDKLAQHRESFDLKFPTLRNWFNEAWIRKHNLDPQQYKHIATRDNPSTLDIVLNAGFITFGAITTGLRIKSLVSMGLDAYRRHTGTVPTRPRANAIVAPTGRIARLQYRWTMFRIRNPRLYAGMQAGALACSLGLNLFLIIDKARRVAKQTDYLREQVDLMKDNIRYLEIFVRGAKNQDELKALLKHYDLTDDQKNFEELQLGVDGLLTDYNKNLADCLKFVDDTFDQFEADAVYITDEDKDELEAVRRDRVQCSKQFEAIQADTNGETRKEKIVKFSDFTRDSLVRRFDEWIRALDMILEIEKIRSLIAQEAQFLVEDLIDVPEQKRPDKISRQAARTLLSIEAAFPKRKVFLNEKDVQLLLEHFVAELMKQSQVA